MSAVLCGIMLERRAITSRLSRERQRTFDLHEAQRRGCHAKNLSSEREVCADGAAGSRRTGRVFEGARDVARQYTGSGGRIESRSA
jgi:hypothetical protein